MGKEYDELGSINAMRLHIEAEQVLLPIVALVGSWLENICDEGLYAKDEIPGVWRYVMTPDARDAK